MHNNLCRGFQTTRIDYEARQGKEILATHYAVLDDGQVLQSNEHVRDCNFNKPSRTWAQAPALPDDAEFIGNYQRP